LWLDRAKIRTPDPEVCKHHRDTPPLGNLNGKRRHADRNDSRITARDQTPCTSLAGLGRYLDRPIVGERIAQDLVIFGIQHGSLRDVCSSNRMTPQEHGEILMAACEELGYALEKFGQAINDPADQPGKPQDWLRVARLRFFTVRSAELPEGELRDLYDGIRDDLTSAALEKMSDEKAFELVERITAYYRKLRDAWSSRPLAPSADADEYTGAVIHPIIEPVLSPDEATVIGGRRVGATATDRREITTDAWRVR
jgi:hypothetical protein